HHLAVNSVSLGTDVVLCHASERLRAQLRERGYRPHVVSLDSFNRSGGAAYCLTLRLDLSTRPTAQREEPFVADEAAALRIAACRIIRTSSSESSRRRCTSCVQRLFFARIHRATESG